MARSHSTSLFRGPENGVGFVSSSALRVATSRERVDTRTTRSTGQYSLARRSRRSRWVVSSIATDQEVEDRVNQWISSRDDSRSLIPLDCDVVVSTSPHIPGVLADVWSSVDYLLAEREEGRDAAALVVASRCADLSGSLENMERFGNYMYTCYDICEEFGVSVTCSPILDDQAPFACLLLRGRGKKTTGAETTEDDDWDDWDSGDSLLAKFGITGAREMVCFS